MSRRLITVFVVAVVLIFVAAATGVACASDGKPAPSANVEKVCGTFQGMTESGHTYRYITYHVRNSKNVLHHVQATYGLVTHTEVDLRIGTPLCVEVRKSRWCTPGEVRITAQ